MKKRTQPIFIEEAESLDLLKKHQRQIWYKLVKEAGNFEKVGHVTKRYQPNNKYAYENASGGTVRSTNFNKFKKGKATPGKLILERVKKDFPRAEYWLNQPLWEILKGPMTLDRADELLQQSRGDLKNRLYKTNTSTGASIRKNFDIDKLANHLLIDGTFEALNVWMLLMVEDEHHKKKFNTIIRKSFMAKVAIKLMRNICLYQFHSYFGFLLSCFKNRFLYFWKLNHFSEDDFIEEYNSPTHLNLEDASKIIVQANNMVLAIEDYSGLVLNDQKAANTLLLGFDRLSNKAYVQAIAEMNSLRQTGITPEKTPHVAKIVSDMLKNKF